MAHKFLQPAAVVVILASLVTLEAQQRPASPQPSATDRQAGSQDDGFRFKSSVDLVNVTATVVDSSGRFVPGLTKDDFLVYEDDARQTITHFGSDRVPVSLGIVLDTSTSMEGEKFRAARIALEQFLTALNDPNDEFFLYRFADDPVLVQGWTADRETLSRALSRLTPKGDTALYDAVAEAIPLAARGRNTKKALVIISDGNDTRSLTELSDLHQLIRSTEVLVYAIGIDSNGGSSVTVQPPSKNPPRQPPSPIPPTPRYPLPTPQPFPPRRPGLNWQFQWPPQQRRPTQQSSRTSDRVNVAALRDITDDSGGRTEIVRDTRDLSPATSNIADELSKQYYLGYEPPSRRDGRWHAIRVELRTGNYRVRARRGYVAN